MIGGFKPKHILYDVVTEIPNRFSFQVSRRFTDFEAFSRALLSLDPTAILQDIPKKHSLYDRLRSLKWGSGAEFALINKRKCLFQRFLTKMLIYPGIRSSHVVHEFLTNKQDWVETLRDDILVDDIEKLKLSPPLPAPGEMNIRIADIDDPYLKDVFSLIDPFYETTQRTSSVLKSFLNAYRDCARIGEDIALTYNTSSLSDFEFSSVFETLSRAYHSSNKNCLDLVDAVESDCYYPLLSTVLTKNPLRRVFQIYLSYKGEWTILANNLHTLEKIPRPPTCPALSSPLTDSCDEPQHVSGTSNPARAKKSINTDSSLLSTVSSIIDDTAPSKKYARDSSFSALKHASSSALRQDISNCIEKAKAEFEKSDALLRDYTDSMKANLKIHKKICDREIKNVLLCFASAQANFHKKTMDIWKDALERSEGTTIDESE